MSAQPAAAGISAALRVFIEGRRGDSEVTARHLAVTSEMTARYLAATSEMTISAQPAAAGSRGHCGCVSRAGGDSEATARYIAVTSEVASRYLAVTSKMTIYLQPAAAGITGALRMFIEGRRGDSEVIARYLAVTSAGSRKATGFNPDGSRKAARFPRAESNRTEGNRTYHFRTKTYHLRTETYLVLTQAEAATKGFRKDRICQARMSYPSHPSDCLDRPI